WAGALGRVDDLARRRIEDAVVERLEPDPDVLAVHGVSELGQRTTDDESSIFRASYLPAVVCPLSSAHSMICATTPAPTVRPPSRSVRSAPPSSSHCPPASPSRSPPEDAPPRSHPSFGNKTAVDSS